MSVNHSPKTFAFGGNEIDGCQCPALAAGMDPVASGDDHIPGLLEVAEWYDGLVQNHQGQYEGTVGEEIAKDAWIEMMRNDLEQDTAMLSAAEEVAAYHDWI